MVTQSGPTSFLNYSEIFPAIHNTINQIFHNVTSLSASIPSFGDTWGFTIGSLGKNTNELSLKEVDVELKRRGVTNLNFYDGTTHIGSINLPKYLRDAINSETRIINQIYDGEKKAKITLTVYESLTCSHCANFHNKIYPDLKKEFIDKGIVKIEFKHFPLDMAALNASKISQCKNDGKSDILHLLFSNQNKWLNGETIEDLNLNLKKIIKKNNLDIDFDKCINDKDIEDFILNSRIDGTKKFGINSTPTIIINNKKFDKPLNFKNLKKTIEKLI